MPCAGAEKQWCARHTEPFCREQFWYASPVHYSPSITSVMCSCLCAIMLREDTLQPILIVERLRSSEELLCYDKKLTKVDRFSRTLTAHCMIK